MKQLVALMGCAIGAATRLSASFRASEQPLFASEYLVGGSLYMRKVNLCLVFVLSCSMLALAAKLKQVAMVDLPGNPGFSQVAIANGHVVITRPETNTIEIFNPVKRRVVARISQVDGPRGIAVDDSVNRLYIALAGSNRVAVVNSNNWQVEQLIPVRFTPEKLLWVPETKTLFVSSVRDRCISILDLRLGTETSVLELNALPQDMLYDPARQQLLVSLQDANQIAAVDRSNKIAGRFTLMASEPTGLALDLSRRRLYVAVRYAVVALNADTGRELFRIPAPGGTDALTLDTASNLLYAAAGDGSVMAIDVQRRVVDHELPTDIKGYSIAYDPSHKMLFFAGGREGRSKLVILRPVSVAEPNAPQLAANPPSRSESARK
jgi:hypothetical protein